MLRHIIMFKLKDTFDKTELQKASEIVKEKLENLKLQISEIKSLEVGINVVEVPWSFDIVLSINFKNIQDFDNYKNHPAHLAFIEFNKQYTVTKAAVDYII